ncbi:MAG TPA: flagellar filament capping protein FliD [Oscillatoriaceae cyanobacterium]
MLDWNTRVPLRLSFDPLSTSAVPRTAGQELSRELIGNTSPAAFHNQIRVFSSAVSTHISVDSRSGLYHQLQQQLSQLQSSLALPSLFLPATTGQVLTGGTSATDTAIASRSPLDLGTAITPAPPTSSTINKTKPLDTQPFAEAITAGKITVTTAKGSASISIDPTTDSLNSVLSKLKAVKIGGVKPITSVGFNTTTNKLTIKGSVAGSDLTLADTNGGNFLTALAGGGDTETETVQGAKVAKGTGTNVTYKGLQVSYGSQNFTVGPLTVKNGAVGKLAKELAAGLNADSQFAASGLSASAASGKLKITGSQGAVPPNLQLTEVGPAGDLALNLDATSAKSTLNLVETAATGSATAQTLGPGATLNNLAGQLGLSPVNGQYQFELNGKTLTFSGNETLNDVIGGINNADVGVKASYDPTGQRVVLQSQQSGQTNIDAQDLQGNLLQRLGLTGANAQVTQGQAATTGTPVATDNPQLKDIAGLQGVNGQFAIRINGNAITFNQNDTAQAVVSRINEAQVGVTATFDATSQRFTLTGPQTQPPLTGTDLQGNFFATVGRIQPEEATTNQINPQALQGLQHIADQLNQVVGLLQTATGQNGAFKNDGLTRDLQEALKGLITPANGQQNLADLGFSLQNGQVTFDATKFQQLAQQNPSQVQNTLNDVLTNRVAPLLSAGTQAIGDEEALGPLQQRLAQQTVAVRGEISRLQSQQQLLLFEQANFEKEQASLKQQGQSLQTTHGKLSQDKQHQDQTQTATPPPAQPAPAATPVASPSPAAPATEATGLLSFGLSS